MNTEQQAEKLVSWIRERVSAAGCKGVVLGISGGLDSAVAAVLSKSAFPDSTLGLIMPCHSSKEDMEHARALAEKFSIPTKTVVLESIFDALIKLLPDNEADADIKRLTQGNLKARLRMLTLYYLANQLGYLVVGSSNRDELTVGYFTKHGDGGTDILPLGNMVKGQVRELARYLDIPQPIIDKAPSAGLWGGQTDEADLGFSYDELDQYLLSGKAPAELKGKIEAMIALNDHKRNPPLIAKF